MAVTASRPGHWRTGPTASPSEEAFLAGVRNNEFDFFD
jgi:hypothetical protein